MDRSTCAEREYYTGIILHTSVSRNCEIQNVVCKIKKRYAQQVSNVYGWIHPAVAGRA